MQVLNIGGSNVLGEFIPFMLLFAPKLKSLGQWFNTMIYGVELLRQLPGHENDVFPAFEEFRREIQCRRISEEYSCSLR